MRWLGILIACLALTACDQRLVSFRNDDLGRDYYKKVRLDGFLSKPQGDGPFPAVVLLQHCGGMKPAFARDWPSLLADLGYVALAVDTLGGRGMRTCDDSRRGTSWTLVEMVNDAYGAFDYLAQQKFVDKTRIGVMGFSIGANSINNALVRWGVRAGTGRDFKAAISLYGHCRDIGAAAFPFPLMVITGEKEKATATCRNAKKRAPGLEHHVLAGAYHAFDEIQSSGRTDSGGNYMEYSRAATLEARRLVKAFLARHLAK
jgi:dienelactone hydrolase